VEFAIVPPMGCLFLGRLFEDHTGLHRPTAGSRYLVMQPYMIAKKIVYRELDVEAAW
jgi:hypothetical protein